MSQKQKRTDSKLLAGTTLGEGMTLTVDMDVAIFERPWLPLKFNAYVQMIDDYEVCGRGSTQDEAIENLKAAIRRRYEHIHNEFLIHKHWHDAHADLLGVPR